MKEAFDIAELIRKKLLDELSDSERELLLEWREKSIDNEVLYQRGVSRDFFVKGIEEHERFDSKQAYVHFLNKKYQRNSVRLIYKKWLVAASIVLPLLITVLLYRQFNKTESINIVHNNGPDISVGTNKATLTLADGRSIQLGTDENGGAEQLTKLGLRVSDSSLLYETNNPKIQTAYNELYVPRGAEFFVTLSDGTKVWLNSETTLKYPTSFASTERKVYVQGEAYFEVVKNKNAPFRIEKDQTIIEVLGTKFNVHGYPNEQYIQTTLVEGSVKVSNSKSNNAEMLKPNEQAQVDVSSGKLTKRAVDVVNFVGWKSGKYVFSEQSLEDIMHVLARWYDIQVVFQDESIKKMTLSGTIKRYNDFSHVIDLLEMTGDISCKMKAKTLYIERARFDIN